MNRRNFIKGLLATGAAFTVLPGAGRLWKVTRAPILEIPYVINPDWVNAPYEISMIMNHSQWGAIEYPQWRKRDQDEIERKEWIGEEKVYRSDGFSSLEAVRKTPYPARFTRNKQHIPVFIPITEL